MFLGWKVMNIDCNAYPTVDETGFIASCFILFSHVVYIGEIKENGNT